MYSAPKDAKNVAGVAIVQKEHVLAEAF
jgi:hypothetical protein